MFTEGPSITIRAIVLVLVSLALMTLDHRQQHLDSIRSTLSVVVYPLQALLDLPGNASLWFRESLATRRQLQEENASLHTQQLMINSRLQKLEALEAENLRLRELLGSSFQLGERVLVAELMSVDLDPYKHLVALNKGDLEEVYPGQAVLDESGIMGQVIHVGPLNSTVMLITDPDHAIPVLVNRTGLRTVALGTGAIDQLDLPHIPVTADIRPGDLLVTSGLGGRFPPGYPVAVVDAVIQDPGQAFSRVSAVPRARLDRSREVLLVRRAHERLPLESPQPAPEIEIDGAGGSAP
ncbi:MAG: rod shape-determining protein MreC [Gammaproteobacteria bacterium]